MMGTLKSLNFGDAFEEQHDENLTVENPNVRRSERIAVKST